MDNAAVKLTYERPEQNARYYRGVSTRNPVYTFEVSVETRGSNNHGISLYGTSRISFIALYLRGQKIVSLPRYDQIGYAYELRPLEEQILRDVERLFPSVQLRVVT